jgi:hypothetical protein
MRRKFVLMLLVLTVISTLKSMPNTQAAGPVVAVTSVYDVTEIGRTFFVNITATGATSVVMWAINLTWDPNIIQITTGNPDPNGQGALRRGKYNIYEGSFLKSVNNNTGFTANKIDNTLGRLVMLSCSFGVSGISASGDGVMVTINFTSVSIGTANIDINGPSTTHPGQSWLIDTAGKEIPHEDRDGVVTDQGPPQPQIWTEPWFQGTIVGIAVVAVVATAFRYRKKIAQHLPKHEEEAEELVEEDLRFQKSRI